MNTTLQIQITDKCNLRCSYCYVNQRNTQLNFEIFLKQYKNLDKILKEFTIYKPEISNLEIGYFGGEPLLNLKTILEIDDFLTKEKRKISSHIQTNGTLLTKEIIKTLEEHHIKWNYSYDGIWQEEPIMKKRVNENIFSNSPKVMISKKSLSTLLENYKYFEELGILNPDFTLVRDDIWDEKDFEIYDENLKKLVEYLLKRTKETKKIHSIGLLDLYIADTFIGNLCGKRPFGCFAGTHGLVFTPSGIIYPCTRFYTNNKFPLYDCHKDILYKENILFLQKNSNPRNYKKCLDCSLYTHCNSSCSYSALVKNNFTSLEPIDSVCEMLKISYKYAYYFYNRLSECIDIKKYLKKIYFNE